MGMPGNAGPVPHVEAGTGHWPCRLVWVCVHHSLCLLGSKAERCSALVIVFVLMFMPHWARFTGFLHRRGSGQFEFLTWCFESFCLTGCGKRGALVWGEWAAPGQGKGLEMLPCVSGRLLPVLRRAWLEPCWSWAGETRKLALSWREALYPL